jgi:hypothetical protein
MWLGCHPTPTIQAEVSSLLVERPSQMCIVDNSFVFCLLPLRPECSEGSGVLLKVSVYIYLLRSEQVMVWVHFQVIGKFEYPTVAVRGGVEVEVSRGSSDGQASAVSYWSPNQGSSKPPCVPSVSYSLQAPIALSTPKMGKQRISSLALLLPVLAGTANAASEPSRPRGVGPECRLHLPALARTTNGLDMY